MTVPAWPAPVPAQRTKERAMTQDWNNLYIDEELRRLEREHPSWETQHRIAWFLDQSRQPRRARPRTVVRWLGDRLVAAGERLRAWSAVELAPPGPSFGGGPRLSSGRR